MLIDELEEYVKSGIYPFHMPGHKRREDVLAAINLCHDLTEAEGVDDLHCANGILRNAMDNASRFFGADRSFFLVNGSTCGILAALAACLKSGDKIICARNCHKSVYNGISLLHLDPQYVYAPAVDSHFGIYGSIKPESVEALMNREGDIRAVILTSPTYEGVISDIKAISDICKRHGAILIVDEAHGAHLGHFDGFPDGAVKSGADIVIQSAHKTLGAITQSALLHICGDRVSADAVAQWLAVFETSSPSYLIMESIDHAVRSLQSEGEELFSRYIRRLDRFSEKAKSLEGIEILYCGKNINKGSGDIFAFDRGKLVISGIKKGLSGTALSKLLLKKYKIQLEMSSLNYAVAMTSYCDTDEGFERLYSALNEIDKTKPGETALDLQKAIPSVRPAAVMKLYKAQEAKKLKLPLEQSAGAISAEFVYAYPPGIPLIAPGELITAELIELIKKLLRSGAALRKSLSGEQPVIAAVIS